MKVNLNEPTLFLYVVLVAKGRQLKSRWLDRDTVRAPHTTLCLSEASYLQAAREYGISSPPAWLAPGHGACVHHWERPYERACVVCLRVEDGDDPITVAGSLVHEAVHIFQALCESIGESEPSKEFQAYSIERISERLMREYVRQTKGRQCSD